MRFKEYLDESLEFEILKEAVASKEVLEAFMIDSEMFPLELFISVSHPDVGDLALKKFNITILKKGSKAWKLDALVRDRALKMAKGAKKFGPNSIKFSDEKDALQLAERIGKKLKMKKDTDVVGLGSMGNVDVPTYEKKYTSLALMVKDLDSIK